MPKLPIRPRARKPDLRVGDILRWADAFHTLHRRWPKFGDGRVAGTPDLTWLAVNRALNSGHRGLPGGDTLAKLLFRCRGRWHQRLLPPLTIDQVLVWADAHHQRTGEWPNGHDTTQIPKAPKGTTWVAVQVALGRGGRGLPAGLTLAQLLDQHRGVRNRKALPPFTEAQILGWADEFHASTGAWPTHDSGAIAAAPGETWSAVESALSKGIRGLPGGDSLAKLLARRRGVRNRMGLPPLVVEQILAWAGAHRERTGRWPRLHDGPIPEAPWETWSGINVALARGSRGMLGGSTLAQFLKDYRTKPDRMRMTHAAI